MGFQDKLEEKRPDKLREKLEALQETFIEPLVK